MNPGVLSIRQEGWPRDIPDRHTSVNLPSPVRVAERHLSRVPWTSAYLKRLVSTIEEQMGPGTPGARGLQRLIRQKELGFMDPYPIEKLEERLEDWEAYPEEFAALRAAHPPRSPRPLQDRYGISVWDAISAVEKASGKDAIQVNIDLDKDYHLIPALLMWAKAFKTLPKYRRAWNLLGSEVKKLRLQGKGRGPDASWEPGLIFLNLSKTPQNVEAARQILVHELGHALEAKLGLIVTAWDDTPYGHPPYVSTEADVNAAEDFAETFRALEVEPALLRRIAPAKYTDMKGTV